jgi:O-antigen ligase
MRPGQRGVGVGGKVTSLRISHEQSSGQTASRLGFDEYLVMAVVAALFFESPEDSLWLKHGFPIPNVTFVLVGLVVIGRAAYLASRGRFDLSKPKWRELTVIGVFAVFAVAALAAALLGHAHPHPSGKPLILVSHLVQSIKTFAHFAYLALIALLLGRFFTPALLRRAFVTFFVLAVAAAVVACLQALDQNVLHTGATGSLHLVSRQATNFIRPCSIFSEPAILGYYLLIGTVIGLWLSATSASRWIWVGIGFCVVATLLGAAAGPAVAFFVTFVYLAWRAWRVLRQSWRELAMIGVAAVAVLVLLPVGQTLSQRATNSGAVSQNSDDFRSKFNRASLTIWELSPLTGVGLGNDRYYNPVLVHFGHRFSAGQQTEFQSVNSYLGTLSESGIFALLMLAVMLVGLVFPFGRVRQEGAWVTEVPILLFIVSFFFINMFVYPIFWFWVAARLAQLRELERLGETAQRQTDSSVPVLA